MIEMEIFTGFTLPPHCAEFNESQIWSKILNFKLITINTGYDIIFLGMLFNMLLKTPTLLSCWYSALVCTKMTSKSILKSAQFRIVTSAKMKVVAYLFLLFAVVYGKEGIKSFRLRYVKFKVYFIALSIEFFANTLIDRSIKCMRKTKSIYQ